MPDLKYRMKELFVKLALEGKLNIVWQRSSAKIGTDAGLKDELKKNEIEVKESDFIQCSFEFINELRAYVLNLDKTEIEGKDENLIGKFLEEKPDIKDDIIVRSTSNNNLISDIDYEILTKRNKDDLTQIDTYSALLNITYQTLNENENGSIERNVTVELSKEDLQDTINKLKEILGKIEEVGE